MGDYCFLYDETGTGMYKTSRQYAVNHATFFFVCTIRQSESERGIQPNDCVREPPAVDGTRRARLEEELQCGKESVQRPVDNLWA